jgi:ABC-type branched-subunit amino acid transport system ATPase component
MDMPRPLLRVDSVSLGFGGLQALQTVSFAVHAGELLGLIGPNGSGKTTLLNVINGYYAPDAGEVYLGNERIGGLSPYQVSKRGIIRMFQVTRIFPRMTVLENMLTVAYAVGRIPGRDILPRAQAILSRLSLDRLTHAEAGALSGGQRKLLEFGTCFMADPHLVLLDEPFASIHPDLKAILEEFMTASHTQAGTILLVSHDIPSVVAACPRVIVLNAGSVIADGPTEEVIRMDEVAEAYLGAFDGDGGGRARG